MVLLNLHKHICRNASLGPQNMERKAKSESVCVEVGLICPKKLNTLMKKR
jgi:hypothetical protein